MAHRAPGTPQASSAFRKSQNMLDRTADFPCQIPYRVGYWERGEGDGWSAPATQGRKRPMSAETLGLILQASEVTISMAILIVALLR
jgi:hypothetical protein